MIAFAFFIADEILPCLISFCRLSIFFGDTTDFTTKNNNRKTAAASTKIRIIEPIFIITLQRYLTY